MLWGKSTFETAWAVVKTKPKRSKKKEYKEKANQNLYICNPIEAIGSLAQQEQTRRTTETRECCQKRQDYNVLAAGRSRKYKRTAHCGHERESNGKFVGENTARDENVLNTFTAGRRDICQTTYAPIASSPKMQHRLSTRG